MEYHVGGGMGKRTVGKENKPIFGIYIATNKEELLSTSKMKGDTRKAWLVILGAGSLCYWQIGHLAVALDKLVLTRRYPYY
jgi:hypothetical protein